MTKRFFLVAAVALLFTACAKDEVDVVTPIQKQGSGQLTIGASFENNATKSDIDDNGNFTWSTEDGIKVYSNTHYWSVLDIVENESEQELGPKFEYANFTSYAFQGDYISTAAVFPKTIIPVYNDPTLSLTIPSEIGWNDTSLEGLTVRTMQADNIMVARGFVDGANTLDFKNVGGLFRLTLNNVPTGASKLEFITNKKINGTFAVGTVLENDIEYPVINTSDSYEEGENIVTINFTTLTEPTKMVYFIPVPVGTYQIGFAVKDGNDTVLWEFHSTANNSVARAHVIKMPTLSHITVGGGGEGATNIIVTPTAYSGTVNLPSTQNNIYVKMNETDGTINLEYSSAANAQHPENVYLQALGDITALNINLPDSHVELTGTDANNVHVLTNVSASTTINTFVVDNKVQIGKTEDNQAVGGLTINGGSLDLSAKVEGPVTVVYDVVSETVNKTTEKVSININSAIKDLVVTSASTQSAPDKIYVTLGASSKVNETLSVPETNCNLYIAPGAQAKTVTTKAAENTIAGAIEHLAAEGDGTSVVVEKEGSVTESISSSDRASIVIVERTETEIAQNQAGYITEDTATSTQGTIDTVADNAVAMIGSESYSTLAAAFAAVADGQTIKLISDVTLEGTFVVALGEKAVTLDLGGKTLTGRTNLTSGNLTLQNGNVVNTDGQPLNVYGSDTQGAQNYSVLSVARDVTVTGKYGVCVFGKTASTNGYGAVVNVEGKLIANNGIFVSGNLGNNVAADMNNIVNISGTLTSESDVAVALNGWATVNVQSGAKITGNTGIAVKRGVLNVYDGATVTANGQWVTPPAANNSGTEPTGAAVSMTNTYNNYGAMAVNIAGGSFTSINGEALYKANQTYSNAATFTVTGGSFSSDPSAFVPAGLEAVKNGNVWTVQNSTYKASIGSQLYLTLTEAIEAAQAGDEITILADQTITRGYVIDKSLTINLNGKTVSFEGVVGNGRTYVAEGFTQSRAFKITGSADFTLKNGTVALNEALLGSVRFSSTGNLLLENYTTNNSRGWGLNIKLEDGTAVLKNVTINSVVGGGVEVNGPATATMTDCVINQTGKDSEPWISAAVSVAYGGHLTVNSGSYSALYASYIYTSGGTLDILGGTFTGRVDGSLGAAVMIQKDNASYPEPNAIVNINKGTFNGKLEADNPNCALNISGGTFNKGDFSQLIDIKPVASASITGGTFDSDPSAYVAGGYAATHTGNVWKVGLVNGVAAIGSTGYNTLAAAVAAAQDGDTITILQDFALTTVSETILGVSSTKYNVVISKSITIDGDNHVITASNDKRALAFDGANTQVTIKDLTIKANPTKAMDATLWICNNVNLTLDNVVVDGTSASYSATYNQPITIGSEIPGRPTLNIINGSVVKTNNDATAHYAIIVWSPSDINVSNSTLKGYAAVYVKPQATGTIVNVSNSNVESHGYSGISNAFGMFVAESNNNTFTLTSNNYRITAGDQYQVLTELNKTTGNVVKLLGTSTFTPNDPVHGTLTSSWQKYYVNSLYMDDANKETFANYISSECTVVKETSGTYSGLWKITGPTPEVYYYWNTANGQEGTNCDLEEPFVKGWLCDGEYIDVLKNITLNKTIACQLTSGSFRFNLGEYTVTKGDYSITLKNGVSAVTDKATDIFTAASDGYAIIETVNDNTYTYTAVAATAAIGTTRYATLAAAFEAAQDGNTITLLADCEVSEALVNTKNITLDLGSYSISGTVEAYLLQNKGTLVINADNTNPGKIYNVSTAAKGHGAVLNDTEGTITINGGIFGDNDSDHTNTGTVNSGCALRNRGTATVNGGVFTTAEPDYAGVWAYAIVSGESDVAANITINGGHIYGRHGDLCNNHGTMVINDVTTYGTANYYSIYAWKDGTTTVNGGTYVKNSHTPAVNIQFYADEATASIVVKDGNFTKNTAGNFANGSGSVSLQGGTFNKQPEAAIIANGYAAVDNGDGTWTVVEAPIEAGEGSGRTLAEAVALVKAANGGSIRMVGDDNVTSFIRVEAPTTLDLNGHTITASGPLFNYVTANLTIKDSQGNGTMNVNVGSSRYGIRSDKSGVKVKLEGGTLSAYSTTSSYVHAVAVSSGATFEMTGGKITVPSTSTAGYNYCIEVDSNSNAIISGGEIIDEATGGNYTINNSGSVTISGGYISGKAATGSNWWQSYYPYVLYGSGTFNISGGQIKAIGWENYGQSAHFFGDSTNASITGGLFGGVDIEDANSRAEVSSRVASGYTIVNLTPSDAEYANGYRYKVVAQ